MTLSLSRQNCLNKPKLSQATRGTCAGIVDNLMKHFFQLLSLLIVTSCGPVSYALMLDSRQPSLSGLDLGGKTMSIVYLESENGRDSVFNNKVSDALAIALEEDYYEGEQAIGIYKVTKTEDADYLSKDSLVSYVMSLNTDIVMLLDTPEIIDSSAAGIQVRRSNLYIYDSRGRDEVVNLNCDFRTSRTIPASTALTVGKSLSAPLKSEWKTESYSLVYYEGFDQRWETAVLRAGMFRWDEAISLWMELLDARNPVMRSSAMYNIAMGCYMLEEYELADEWITRSDETQLLSLSSAMHKRIDTALGRAISE